MASQPPGRDYWKENYGYTPVFEKVEATDGQWYYQLKDFVGAPPKTRAGAGWVREDSLLGSSHRGELKQYNTIQDALEYQQKWRVVKLLNDDFGRMTEGDYNWLRELGSVGYAHNEMATLLLNEAKDAPWIVFEPHNFEKTEPATSFHYAGCAHQQTGPFSKTTQTTRPYDTDLRNTVQELCVLAGILPISKDREDWNGAVVFGGDSRIAVIYGSPFEKAKSDNTALLRIYHALENFCTAARYAQEIYICCDSFTFIKKVHGDSKPNNLELVRIKFDLVLFLKNNILSLPDEVQSSTKQGNFSSRAAAAAEAILQLLEIPFTGLTNQSNFRSAGLKAASWDFNSEWEHALHICALATQFLCVGLVSFTQAHLGKFEPFFIDTTIQELLLSGALPSPSEEQAAHIPLIHVSFAELTCLAVMTRGPVLSFSIVYRKPHVISSENKAKHDLICRLDDLLEIWGPGHSIPSVGSEEQITTVEIGGGLLYVVDPANSKFHWGPVSDVSDSTIPSFPPTTRMTIGAVTIVNQNCINDEGDRRACSQVLVNLGVCQDSYELSQKQFGSQFGQTNALFSYNQTYTKQAGIPLKKVELEATEGPALLQVLDCYWGLQVSFCTGIARGVPLRELVADLLLTWAAAHGMEVEIKTWEKKYQVLGAFSASTNFQEWALQLRKADKGVYKHLMEFAKDILSTLRSTGY
ncbi:uncharacterized protein K452DRAFT_334815 [Aplosporella prunicola CBS 121167]|uniref:Uncharacterized protein n=1 Tax=Aplosporella prunicola CBS 121167 TaxID=1176127 RepID=A0A6A6BB51_9PEZI|nr:uncharacterized protein K452DRAFT_334815 [Aplosporella prunicola CBS 121167]KAF2140475.1 hypothetical protein K452DRAFT_334815 [Aplosporella prunicola CBS 121167]